MTFFSMNTAGIIFIRAEKSWKNFAIDRANLDKVQKRIATLLPLWAIQPRDYSRERGEERCGSFRRRVPSRA